jgi:adenine/guanine phosphoribosyltransferase-like PRPP-binding protein
VLAAAPFPRPAPGRQEKTAGTFTVSVWCKPDSFATLTPPRTSGWSPAGDLHSFLFYPPAGEKLYGQGHASCGLVAGRNGVSVIERAGAALEAVLVAEAGLSGWTHIALVYQDNTPSVYIDGKLVSRGRRSRFTVHPGVGESFQSDGAGYFEGDQCAPEIVPKALSDVEIAAMVQQGPPRFTPHRAVEITLLPSPGLLVWEPGRWRVHGVPAAEIQAAPPPAVEVAGPWTVSFPPGLGAPASIRLERLIPLQRHPDPGVRYFSGTARYEADLAWNHELKPSQRACLDLGRVAVIAQVSLNGQPAGQFWKPPFRADVTSLLRRGPNRLEVLVTNLWVNRLIGDEQLPPEAEFLATPEAKSIPLCYAMSVKSGLPYAVLRKSFKPYMLGSISTDIVSITTAEPQKLWLDGKDRPRVAGKRVVIVDDVISTGGTLRGARALLEQAGAQVIASMAIMTEGDEGAWPDVIALGHLPVWIEKAS